MRPSRSDIVCRLQDFVFFGYYFFKESAVYEFVIYHKNAFLQTQSVL